MPSSKTALKSRYGHELPVAAAVSEGSYDYSGSLAATATTAPTSGSFVTDNFGVTIQCTTDCYVSFNGTVATTNSFKMFANLIYDFPYAVSAISVISAGVDGTIKWHCIRGED